MTSKRKAGFIVFSCNRPGCGAELKVVSNRYHEAWEQARAAGWVAAKFGSVWLHWCSWVHRPRNDDVAAHAAATTDAEDS